MHKLLCCCCLLIIMQSALFSQTRLGCTVKKFSGFVASDYFAGLHNQCSDLALVDTIYKRILDYNNHDIGETLLAITFVTVPYNKIPVVLPLLRLHINIPIYSAPEQVFRRKNHNLPKQLFFNSPMDSFGDKDKLAHFFGSAYLGYNSRVFDITKVFGIFVEEFEEKFYVQSEADPRDIGADRLGELFGKALKEHKNIFPSSVFIFFNLTYFRYSL